MSRAHPTAPPKPSKPPKPYPGFPLFPHATRRWAKKVRGKLHCFGPWDDPEDALNKCLEQRDDLHAGARSRNRCVALPPDTARGRCQDASG
jgi:hypothetical protein